MISSPIPQIKQNDLSSPSATKLSSKLTASPSPPQKLFLRPGTIEEEEENESGVTVKKCESDDRVYSEVLLRPGHYSTAGLSKVPSVSRVSTCNSSLTYMGARQESYSKNFKTGALRNVRQRIIHKNGKYNVILKNRPIKVRLLDTFNLLVDAQWRWTLLAFCGAHMLTWLLFAVIWWLIFFVHGDLQEDHLPPNQDNVHWTPCVNGIYDFTSCFLYSVETQSTIGYGDRVITEECPEGVFLVAFQSVAALIIDGYVGAVIGAKMIRPRQRASTLLFTENAVICKRDGQLCFMFRVGDLRNSMFTEAGVQCFMIKSKLTKEGEVIEQYTIELDVSPEGSGGDIIFIWPTVMVHKIDENSPFFNMSPEKILEDNYEIVVVLEGTTQATGQGVQKRTSYLATEILWGHKFENMICYNKELQGYDVDYRFFNTTVPVETPFVSAKELKEREESDDEDNDDDDETCSDETSDAPSTPPAEIKKKGKKDKYQQVQQMKQIKDRPEENKKGKQQQKQEPPKNVNRTEWFETATVVEKPGNPLRIAEATLTRQVYGVTSMKK